MTLKECDSEIDHQMQVIRIYRDMANVLNANKLFELEGRVRSTLETAQSLLADLQALYKQLEKEYES